MNQHINAFIYFFFIHYNLTNSMYPSFPPYSNRIYVNPKFNGGQNQQMMAQQQQQMMAQQQQFAQRQFMELEAQRLNMLQQQAQQKNIDLDQKRRELQESMRKRREAAQSTHEQVVRKVHTFVLGMILLIC